MQRNYSSFKRDPWNRRIKEDAQAKNAASLICLENNLIARYSHIFLDSGSTFVYLANAIFNAAPRLTPLTITTNNAEIIPLYLGSKCRSLVDMRLIGGRFVAYQHCFDGVGSTLFNFSEDETPVFDIAFLGTSSLSSDLKMMVSITDFMTIKQRAIARSRQAILLCTTSKLVAPSRGSREVAQLQYNLQDQMCLVIDNPRQVSIPTRLVFGLTGEELPDWFTELAEKDRRLESQSVILAMPEEVVK